MLKFGTKNVLLDIFDQTSLIWVFLGWNFQKTMVIFEISTPKFSYLQNLARKQKCLNLGAKMSYLGIFGEKKLKNYCLFEISTLKFVYLQKPQKN